jgi:hypothetical protein
MKSMLVLILSTISFFSLTQESFALDCSCDCQEVNDQGEPSGKHKSKQVKTTGIVRNLEEDKQACKNLNGLKCNPYKNIPKSGVALSSAFLAPESLEDEFNRDVAGVLENCVPVGKVK